jgi:SAM-dependent methyltransferase
VLPDYLQCIEALDYPKSRITLQVRTNDNVDGTAAILEAWLRRVRDDYARCIYDSSPLTLAASDSNPHDWSPANLRRIATVRTESLEKFKNDPTDYYFVVDVDNFLAPFALPELVRRREPIVAPMLDTLPLETDPYSNFFGACDDHGYAAYSPVYDTIRTRAVRGALQVPVVHCTYLIERSVIERGLVKYVDGSGRYEFVIFSDSARKSGVRQILVNDRRYGYLLHHVRPNVEAMTLEEERLIYALHCRPALLDFMAAPERKRFGEETFYSWYARGGEGSGPGSAIAYTAAFREFLATFMREHRIESVVDYGCGDWQWARLMDWQGRTYQGFDIVAPLIDRLRKQYERPGVSFALVEDVARFEPPDCDLLICKDVLQHLPNAEAAAIIERFGRHAKHVLWVNDRDPNPAYNNSDTTVGGYRRMDLSAPPFSVDGRTVFEFGFAPDHKVVFWQGQGMSKAIEFRSQAGQDRFIHNLAVVGEKLTAGTFLDVGCSDPVALSNSYVLEQIGWRGLLLDCAPELAEPIARLRKSPFVCGDAKTIDWQRELSAAGLTGPIDYLSFDVDYDGLAALKHFLAAGVRFRYATIEHDAYRFGDETRVKMRKMLTDLGYELLCPDVECQGLVFEDWWVDPAAVDMTLAERYRTRASTHYLQIVSR